MQGWREGWREGAPAVSCRASSEKGRADPCPGGGGQGQRLSSWQGRVGVGQPGWGWSFCNASAWLAAHSAPPISMCPSYKASGEEGPPLLPETPEMKTVLLLLVVLAVAAGPGEDWGGGGQLWPVGQTLEA